MVKKTTTYKQNRHLFLLSLSIRKKGLRSAVLWAFLFPAGPDALNSSCGCRLGVGDNGSIGAFRDLDPLFSNGEGDTLRSKSSSF